MKRLEDNSVSDMNNGYKDPTNELHQELKAIKRNKRYLIWFAIGNLVIFILSLNGYDNYPNRTILAGVTIIICMLYVLLIQTGVYGSSSIIDVVLRINNCQSIQCISVLLEVSKYLMVRKIALDKVVLAIPTLDREIFNSIAPSLWSRLYEYSASKPYLANPIVFSIAEYLGDKNAIRYLCKIMKYTNIPVDTKKQLQNILEKLSKK